MLTTSKAGEAAFKSLALRLSSELFNMAEDLSLKAQSEVMDGIDILDTMVAAIDCLSNDIAVRYQKELDRH